MRSSDWSSDVCSSDLERHLDLGRAAIIGIAVRTAVPIDDISRPGIYRAADIGHRLDREAAVVGGPGRNLFRREEREHIDVVAERKPVASVDRLDNRNGRLNNVLVKVPNGIEDQLINRRYHRSEEQTSELQS